MQKKHILIPSNLSQKMVCSPTIADRSSKTSLSSYEAGGCVRSSDPLLYPDFSYFTVCQTLTAPIGAPTAAVYSKCIIPGTWYSFHSCVRVHNHASMHDLQSGGQAGNRTHTRDMHTRHTTTKETWTRHTS